jgi:hypothetical protein
MSIRETLSNDLKVKYRKVKTVPAAIKAAIYAGCTDPGAAMQFQSDVTTYNLFEALLYVEGYEKDGFFAAGTAAKAAGLLK